MAQQKSRQRLPNNDKKVEGPSEDWVTSFSDMMSLMFCLFAVLYGMSKINADKFRQLAEALSMSLSVGGFESKVIQEEEAKDEMEEEQESTSNLPETDGFVPKEKAPSPEEGKPPKDLEQQSGGKYGDLKKIQEEIAKALEEKNLGGRVMMHMEERGLVIGLMTDKLLFQIGQSDLTGSSIAVLDAISPILKKYENPLRIEGNTCNLPISTSQFRSNWDLSAMRAINVSSYLIMKKNIVPDRVSIIGFGEYRPMFPNDTEANRSRNRRVDVIILKGEGIIYEVDDQPEQENPVAPQEIVKTPELINDGFWESFVGE